MKRPAAAAAVAPKKPKKDYPTVGTIIEAKWSTEFGPGKEWYRGKIAKVHAGKTSSRDPSFDVAYDDGELEEKVRWENIRVVDPSTPAPVYDYDEPEIVASKTSLEPTRPRSKREIRAPQKGPLASAALSPPPQPKPRPRQPKQRAPLTVRLPKPPPPKPPVPQKESARMVRQLVRTDREKLDLETVRDALRTDPIKDQADHGRVGGMLAGRIGENKYVVEYATDCRAKCKLFSCKRSLFLGELRIGKVPPRVNPLQNKRVHWYHPSCVFQSFRRASKKTKLIDRPEKDLEGWHALQPNDRAFIDLCLRRSREAPGDWALDEDTSSSNAPPEPVDGAAVDLLLSLQAPGAAAAAAAPAAPRPPTYAPPVPRFERPGQNAAPRYAPPYGAPPRALYGAPPPPPLVAPQPAHVGRTGEYASPASPLRQRAPPPAPPPQPLPQFMPPPPAFPDAAAYNAAVSAAAAAATRATPRRRPRRPRRTTRGASRSRPRARRPTTSPAARRRSCRGGRRRPWRPRWCSRCLLRRRRSWRLRWRVRRRRLRFRRRLHRRRLWRRPLRWDQAHPLLRHLPRHRPRRHLCRRPRHRPALRRSDRLCWWPPRHRRGRGRRS